MEENVLVLDILSILAWIGYMVGAYWLYAKRYKLFDWLKVDYDNKWLNRYLNIFAVAMIAAAFFRICDIISSMFK